MSVLYKLASKLGRYSGEGYVVDHPRTSDIYIVEYPKSGVTFFSQMLANALHDEDIGFFSLPNFVIDVHTSKIGGPRPLAYTNLRFIKSHSEGNLFYRNVIYLYRNPLDTLISYYNYLGQFDALHAGTNFDNFVRSHRGVPRWRGHLESWMNSDYQIRFIPVNYSTLLEEPIRVLKHLFHLHGIKVPNSAYDRAIKASNLRTMMEQEKSWSYGGRMKVKAGKMNFIGPKEFTKKQVSTECVAYIDEQTKVVYKSMQNAQELVFGD